VSTATSAWPVLGCDVTSSPTRRKPVVVALGQAREQRGVLVVELDTFQRFEHLQDWGNFLQQPGPWVGGFDAPFGLPRELVQTLGWPETWVDCMRHYAALDRRQIRDTFAAFCQARPSGAKFAHRRTDGPAGSSPSMKWINPPVAFMLHVTVPRLLAAGVHLPGLCAGDPQRVALEAYPGLLARELIGTRSYKSDDRARQTPDRLIARKEVVQALEQGRTRLHLRLRLSAAQHDALVEDASGDTLDAVLCMVQAAWAAQRHAQGDAWYGLPPDLDPLEGWIVTA
jgi:hypothetical protein